METITNTYSDLYKEPDGYTILEYGTPYHIQGGCKSMQYRNMYWKVFDKNENNLGYPNIYYLVYIDNKNHYTKLSCEDINIILNFNGQRQVWYSHKSNRNKTYYVSVSDRTKHKQYYLHQAVMNVHDEDLTSLQKTVDHINHDKLDNRRENLKFATMSEQNMNRDKIARRCDACLLPDGIPTLPKYVQYRTETLKNDKVIDYFFIEGHPKLKKLKITSRPSIKSSKVSIQDKYTDILTKLKELDDDNQPIEILDQNCEIKNTLKATNISLRDKFALITKKIELPYISIQKNHDSDVFTYDHRLNNIRYNTKMLPKSCYFVNEFKIFISKIEDKYPTNPDNNIFKTIITSIDEYINNSSNENTIELPNENTIELSNENTIELPNTISELGDSDTMEFKPKLPANFTFYKEKDKYYIQYSKVINKKKCSKKITISSNNLQEEFNILVNEVNKLYPELKIENFIITNIPSDLKIVEENKIVNSKPKLPTNFSITTVNNVDYIQFCKKLDGIKHQYKTKINSYDLQFEINKFIEYLNTTYNVLQLDKSLYIIQPTDWKTSNKIIDHDNPTEQQLANRKSKQLSNNKKKEELGVEYKDQKNKYMKKYRDSFK